MPSLASSSLRRAPVPPELGSQASNDLDRDYRILGPLGSSITGTTFLARHRELARLVVVKFMHARAPLRTQERFEREARALAKVSHEHVAKLFGYGRTLDGRRFMIVEHIEGRSVRQLLDRWGRLPEPRALRLLDQLCGALDATHGVGLVHRNIKPESVFVGEGRDGRETVKLSNFGLVRDAFPSPDRGAARESGQTGPMHGTPRYWSPEQVLGDPINQRADIYAFGVFAYELLVGKTPFQSTTTEGFAWQHVHARVPRAVDTDGRPRLRRELESLLERCLEKRPEDRFSSMREVREALRIARRAMRAHPERDANVPRMHRPQRRTLAVRLAQQARQPETWLVATVAFLAGLLGAILG